MRKPNNNHNNHPNRQYLTDRQFRKALQTYDTRGRWITNDQWKVVLREVWKRGGQTYGTVVEKADNGYHVDLLGERAFMYDIPPLNIPVEVPGRGRSSNTLGVQRTNFK